VNKSVRVLVGVATAWAALLFPAAFLVPFGYVQGPNGTETERGMVPLVQVLGHGILVLVAIPLVVALLVTGLLVLRERTSSRTAEVSAWALSIGLAAAAVLGTVTFLIGMYVLPVAGLLIAACANSSALTVDAEPRTLSSTLRPHRSRTRWRRSMLPSG
jgi:hypothetical protein